MSQSRYRRGPSQVAKFLPKTVGATFRRRGFEQSEVVYRWAEIVGAELAEVSAPEKLSYRRNAAAGGVLHVRVNSRAAVEFQHLAPTIVERINTYYGYRAVSRLHLLQAPLPVPRRSAPVAEAPLPAERQSWVEETVGTGMPPRLRAALQRLGRQVARRSGGETS